MCGPLPRVGPVISVQVLPYCTPSATCFVDTGADPLRSAMVRATFRIRHAPAQSPFAEPSFLAFDHPQRPAHTARKSRSRHSRIVVSLRLAFSTSLIATRVRSQKRRRWNTLLRFPTPWMNAFGVRIRLVCIPYLRHLEVVCLKTPSAMFDEPWVILRSEWAGCMSLGLWGFCSARFLANRSFSIPHVAERQIGAEKSK